MQAIQMPQVINAIQKLPTNKLTVAFDFISYLIEQEPKAHQPRASAIKLIPTEEYEELLRYKKLAAFNSFTQALGKEVENQGLTEEELMADLEQSKREVFEEEYGSIR